MSSENNSFPRIDDLAQRVADGIAGEDAIAELDALMREDPQARRRYLETVQLHLALERKAARGTLAPESERTVPFFPASKIPRGIGRILAIAAAIALVAGLTWSVLRPKPLAEIVEAKNVVWEGQAIAGDGIEAGQKIRLVSGNLELLTSSGVRLKLRGPCDAVFKDNMRLMLTSGDVFADVSPKGHGFKVLTASVDIVDYGTQFGVRAGLGKDVEVHVFEGEVGVGKEKETNRLTLAQAASFSKEGELDGWIQPDYEGFAAPQLAPGILSVSSDVRWQPDQPPSLARGKFKTGDSISLILESRNTVLKKPLKITFDSGKRGTNTAFSTHERTLPAGTKIDSYLLHFDPSADIENADGRIRFDRRIVGVIAREDQLIASDKILGRKGTSYSANGDNRGLDDLSEPPDIINFVSPNTIAIRFSPQGKGFDQVRILVASD